MTDVRKELSLINKHIRQHGRVAGSNIVWFPFIGFSEDNGSMWDDVYDEGAPGQGGREYGEPIVLPTIYIDEQEDRFTLQEDGRQPTQNVYVVMLFADVKLAGLAMPHEYDLHLNDVFYYDGRYFKVNQYRVRGHIQEEVVIGVHGFEVYVDQEFTLDPGPADTSVQNLPWPNTFPTFGVV